MRNFFTTILIGAALTVAEQACATTLYVMSVGNSQVQVVINGNTIRTLAIGEVSPEGVLLKSIDNGIAEFEVDRKVVRFGLGQSTTSQAVLQIGRDGQFRTTARVNGVPMAALIDTGSNRVVIGSATAFRLGIAYRRGIREMAQTANGSITTYRTTLRSVQVGEIVIENISCNVLEGAQISPNLEVLIGNTFLSQVQMQRSGNTMTLTRASGL